MDKNHIFRPTALGVALATLALSLPGVSEANLKWRFDTDTDGEPQCVTGCAGGSWQSSIEFQTATSSPSGPNVTAEGWANTANSNIDQEIGSITRWGGGLGVRNADWSNGGDPSEGDDPEHAIDNQGRNDWVLLDFGSTNIALQGVENGWTTNDSDMTVLYHDATVSNDAALAGKSYSEMVTAGWKLASQIVNPGTGQASFNADASKSSSTWLVGAYNSFFGDIGLAANGYDYMKLEAVYGKVVDNGTPGVAEPGTMALAAIGLLGLMRVRRGTSARA